MDKKNLEEKAVNIKGKKYVLVSDRVVYFNEKYPNGSIVTNITFEGSYVRCKAIVHPNDVDNLIDQRGFIAHAEELRTDTSSMVNKTSAVENCETSAVGRALAMMGIGVIDSIASIDEIKVAEGKEKRMAGGSSPATAKQKNMIKKLIKEKRGVNAEGFTETFFTDINKERASKTIDYLLKQEDNMVDEDILNDIEVPVVD